MDRPVSLVHHELGVFSNRELWRISVAFVAWMSLLLSIVSHPWVIEVFINRIALAMSYVLVVLLRFCGNEIERAGVIIETEAFRMEVTHKCTAVYQAAVYSAGVFAYHTRLRNKASGVFWGICAIGIANLLRIVVIFYVGVYLPGWLPFVHNVLGEVLMIVLVLSAWLFWVERISKGCRADVVGGNGR